MDKLLTQQDLAERWQVSVKAIESYRKEGIITQVQGIPSIYKIQSSTYFGNGRN